MSVMTPEPWQYPPLGMEAPEAARYVGLSVSKFYDLVKQGRLPKPRRIDGRVSWDRRTLEAAYSSVPTDADEPEGENPWLAGR